MPHLLEASRPGTRRRQARERAADRPQANLAAWVSWLGPPAREPSRSRRLAHIGCIVSIASLVGYLTWRVVDTLPGGGWNLAAAWGLVIFEALPLGGLAIKACTLWNIDSQAPAPVTSAPDGMRVAVLIPTYNEPVEVIAPTVAASCALQPAHETWVLDDGDRPWVEQMCEAFGARYVSRPVHDHAKAGNLNHALDLMKAEQDSGQPGIDVVAVLDCDHVPLPTFLTATLGWFVDDDLALVQASQAFYNSGAFDDDGISGEQGLFFNVLLPSRNHPGAGPFWCGSTSLLRVAALRGIGGVATETIIEDMHTTLKLLRAGWKTVYHHQTLALGLAPATPEQYLLQRRRWGMGSMQILTHERLWAAKRWLSWRNFYEYLTGTLWWLEGVTTVIAFIVPTAILLSGAHTSTANPVLFTLVFLAMFTTRMWGAKRMLRHEIHWPTALALRIFRIPVGIACLWWLISRKSLDFQVTPKGAADQRRRGRTPPVLIALTAIVAGVIVYASAGTLGWVPWRTPMSSTAAAGAWLLVATAVLALGTRRIRSDAYATSRRNAHRIPIHASIEIDGIRGELVDISVGGAAVRFPLASLPNVGLVALRLPNAQPIKMMMSRVPDESDGYQHASLQITPNDWTAYRAISLWLFHTPVNALPGLPPGTPAIALTGVA